MDLTWKIFFIDFKSAFSFFARGNTFTDLGALVSHLSAEISQKGSYKKATKWKSHARVPTGGKKLK